MEHCNDPAFASVPEFDCFLGWKEFDLAVFFPEIFLCFFRKLHITGLSSPHDNLLCPLFVDVFRFGKRDFMGRPVEFFRELFPALFDFSVKADEDVVPEGLFFDRNRTETCGIYLWFHDNPLSKQKDLFRIQKQGLLQEQGLLQVEKTAGNIVYQAILFMRPQAYYPAGNKCTAQTGHNIANTHFHKSHSLEQGVLY